MYKHIYIYIYIYTYVLYIYIYIIYPPRAQTPVSALGFWISEGSTDAGGILVSRCGILMPRRHFPEFLSQRILLQGEPLV